MEVRIWLSLVLVIFMSFPRGSGGQEPTAAEPTIVESTVEDAGSAYEPVTTFDIHVSREELRVMVRPLTRAELEVEAESWFRLLRNKARRIAAVRIGVRRTVGVFTAADDESAEEVLREIKAVERFVDNLDERAGTTIPDDSNSEAGSSSNVDASEIGDSSDHDAGSMAAAAERRRELLDDLPTLQNERTALSERLEIVLASLERKGGDVTEYRQYAAAVAGLELDTSDFATTWAAVVAWFSSKEGGQRWAWNIGKFFLILIITCLLAKVIASVINWLQERKLRLTELAKRLIDGTIKNVVMLIGFVTALTALEVDITPVLAAIGATGLVVGLALQGTLSNFASGLMILINRPFDVGNVVSAGGITGTVKQMNLVATTFRTFDNQTIHVPNNEIWNGVITNITANSTRRVDLEFSISYDDDFEQAERIIREVAETHALVLRDPAPVIVTHELADSSVNIVCRPWAKTSDWWQVKTDVTREVKRRFDREGISIPYPQRDIHLHQKDGRSRSAELQPDQRH